MSSKVSSNQRDIEDLEVRNIIEEMAEGDHTRFDYLVKKYTGRIASIAYGMVGNYDFAEEVTQDVFLNIFKNPSSFDPNRKFFTWLFIVIKNASIDWLRCNRRKNDPLLFHDYILNSGDIKRIEERFDHYGNSPEDLFLREERIKVLKEGMDSVLSLKQKSLFFLRFYEGLTYKKIESAMDITRGSVAWHLSEGKKRLKNYLRSMGY